MTRTLLAACLLAVFSPAGADDLKVLPETIDGVAPQEMIHAYLMRLTEAALDRRLAEYEKIKTPEDVVAYQKRLRQFFVDQLGGFPDRTPLNARVVGKQQRDGYRVEKILFESQPRHYVTAILYLPEAKPPYPAVLVPCGHSVNGKARDLYQRAPILIAKNGMAALCYDPIDQGERMQLLDEGGKPVAVSTTGHSLIGVASALLGRNTATFRSWDGIRAIDYLQSRKEIDPERIGCTGISGGGTMTSYLMALDARIRAAAPGCYLTTMRRLMETIGPQDAEQNIHAQIAYGMDHPDYVIMRAPQPTLIMTATGDYFDIGGAWNNFRQAKRIYTRLGFAERVDLFETDDRHGFPEAMRVAAARWMRRWLLGIDDAITEHEFPVVPDEQVWCTPRGQVMLIEGARSCYDLNIALEEQLAKARKAFWQQTDQSKALDEVRRITGIRKLADLPELKCEKAGTLQRDGYRIDKLILSPEPGIWLPALAFVPKKADGDAYLYLNEAGKQADAAPGGPIEKLVQSGHLVLAVDLRGVGETGKPDTAKRGIPYYIGPDWKDLYQAYMLRKPHLAMRAEDVLGCARFLATHESAGKPNRVHLVGIGRVGPPALHAAALEPALFASVKLQHCLASWHNVVHTPLARHQQANVVHGALKTYDLPDLLATLPKEKLTVIEPHNALEEPIAAVKKP